MTGFPSEWRELPDWVKCELAESEEDLSFYSGYISLLAKHSTSMKPVWKLLSQNREEARPTGPVAALLRLLASAKHGTSPGAWLNSDDRRNIAKDIRRHAEHLILRIDRLQSKGDYPLPLRAQMEEICRIRVEGGVLAEVRGTARRIVRLLEKQGVDAKALSTVEEGLSAIGLEIDSESTTLLHDARPALSVLIEATSHWADPGDWNEGDFVRRVGERLNSWFGGDQSEATATLATAILDREFDVGTVRKTLRRAG